MHNTEQQNWFFLQGTCIMHGGQRSTYRRITMYVFGIKIFTMESLHNTFTWVTNSPTLHVLFNATRRLSRRNTATLFVQSQFMVEGPLETSNYFKYKSTVSKIGLELT
jgi:hypothetical protein